MSAVDGRALLAADDPTPVEFVNPGGRSSFLLIGDHAGKLVPRRLGTLGIGAADRVRHIAWDIGIAALGEALAVRLDARFVRQRYSRLVIDCNRDPARADAIPEVSDGTPIPANRGLPAADRAARVAEIHEPYQQAIAAALRPDDILVALHSFTPRLADGADRPWQAGVLHDAGDAGFALATLAALRREPGLTVGDNEPYRMDGADHSVPRHAYPARPYVEFEVRQDLISDDAGVAEWADRLARVLAAARG